MASFPSLPLDENSIKVRYLEPFGSEAINKKDLDTPLGIYSGFLPSVTGGSAILSLFADFTKGRSVLKVDSTNSHAAMTIAIENNIDLDFTGHDFATNSPIYVIATADYQSGSATTASISTSIVAPDGRTTIGICRVQSATNDPLDMQAFATDAPDRHQPLATAGNSFGYMVGGSAESLATLVANAGKEIFETVVETGAFALVADSKIRMFDYSALNGAINLTLPSGAATTEGCKAKILLVAATNSLGLVCLKADLADDIVSEVGVLTSKLAIKDFLGHYVEVVLRKTGLARPQWHIIAATQKVKHGDDHKLGANDEILLDELGTPLDNTNLDATTNEHGLLPKLSGNVAQFLDGTGAFSSPAGASSGANSYIFKTPALSGTSHALLADGEVYILSPPGGSGVTSYSLPNAGSIPSGSVVRCFFLQDAPAYPNTVSFLSTSGQFVWNGAQVSGNSLPGLTSDWRRGQFLEFTLQRPTGGNLWISTANTRPEPSNLMKQKGSACGYQSNTTPTTNEFEGMGLLQTFTMSSFITPVLTTDNFGVYTEAGNASGNTAGYFHFNGDHRFRLAQKLTQRWKIKTPSSTTRLRWFCGWTDASTVNNIGSLDSPNESYIGFQFSGLLLRGDTNFQLISRESAAQGIIDTGITFSLNTTYYIDFESLDSVTPTVKVTLRNSAQVELYSLITIAATLPQISTDFGGMLCAFGGSSSMETRLYCTEVEM